MGTSNSYGGPNGRNPLVPSWLEPNKGSSNEENDKPSIPQVDSPLEPPELPPIPPACDPVRFSIARNNYSRFARSGGQDRSSLGRAVSKYISRSLGGAKQAAQRMGPSRTVGAKLVNFLTTATNQGVPQALKAFNLQILSGRPIEEVFIGLASYICPEGGTIDESIARDAFIETIADLAENGITSLDGLTSAQIRMIFELYATHAIEERLFNDIGAKTIVLPANEEVAKVQELLHDFIRRGVEDALNKAQTTIQSLTLEQAHNFVDDIYEQAFMILQSLGEAEDHRK